jgi:hypothetical protein
MLSEPPGRTRGQREPARRFPPPWSVEELDKCFVVCDHDGQQLAYIYFEDEIGGQAAQPRDEARRIAANTVSVARLIRKS